MLHLSLIYSKSHTYGDSGIGTNFVMSHLSPRIRSKCSTNSFRYTDMLSSYLSGWFHARCLPRLAAQFNDNFKVEIPIIPLVMQ